MEGVGLFFESEGWYFNLTWLCLVVLQVVPPMIQHQTRHMDVYEIALNYNDCGHAGDKRKKSQQCFLTHL